MDARVAGQRVADRLRLPAPQLVDQQDAEPLLGHRQVRRHFIVRGADLAVEWLTLAIGILDPYRQLDLTRRGRGGGLDPHFVAGRQRQRHDRGGDFLVVDQQLDAGEPALKAEGVDRRLHRQLALDGHRRRLGDDAGEHDVALAVARRRLTVGERVDRAGERAPAAGLGQRGPARAAVVGAVAQDEQPPRRTAAVAFLEQLVERGADVGAFAVGIARLV